MSECGFVRVFGNGTVRPFKRLKVKKGLGNGWGFAGWVYVFNAFCLGKGKRVKRFTSTTRASYGLGL